MLRALTSKFWCPDGQQNDRESLTLAGIIKRRTQLGFLWEAKIVLFALILKKLNPHIHNEIGGKNLDRVGTRKERLYTFSRDSCACGPHYILAPQLMLPCLGLLCRCYPTPTLTPAYVYIWTFYRGGYTNKEEHVLCFFLSGVALLNIVFSGSIRFSANFVISLSL